MVLYLKDSRQKFKLLEQARLFASTFAVEKSHSLSKAKVHHQLLTQ